MGGARARENQVPLLRSRVVSLVSARTLVVCTLHLLRSIPSNPLRDAAYDHIFMHGRYFDFVWDLCHRMDLASDRCGDFLASPARLEILHEIEHSLLRRVRAVRLPCSTSIVLDWSMCFNCETKTAVANAASKYCRNGGTPSPRRGYRRIDYS